MNIHKNLTVLELNLTDYGDLPTHLAMHDSVSHVHLILVPVMVGYGLVANLSCGLILSFSKLHRLPLTVLLSACVYSDSVFLVGLLCTWLATGAGVVYQSVQWCYFISMLTNTAHFLSTWCQVAVLGHCYILVATSRVCSVLLAKMLVVGITILAVVIFVNLTLLTDAQSLDDVSFCRPLAAYISIAQILNKLDLLINTIIPYLISLTLISLSLRILKCESYVLVNFSGSPVQDGSKKQHRREFSTSEQSARLAKAISYIFSLVLVLSLPSLLLRVVHTVREVFIVEHNIKDGEILAQSIGQYLVYLTYTLKGLFLPFLWGPYRNMTVKIVRRLLGLLALPFRCNQRRQFGTMTALLNQNNRVNLMPYPHVHTVTTL